MSKTKNETIQSPFPKKNFYPLIGIPCTIRVESVVEGRVGTEIARDRQSLEEILSETERILRVGDCQQEL